MMPQTEKKVVSSVDFMFLYRYQYCACLYLLTFIEIRVSSS